MTIGRETGQLITLLIFAATASAEVCPNPQVPKAEREAPITNMTPQSSLLNEGIWVWLEKLVRDSGAWRSVRCNRERFAGPDLHRAIGERRHSEAVLQDHSPEDE
jgi:hypothetical protein